MRTAIEIDTHNFVHVTIKTAPGENTRHLGVKAANAARKFAKTMFGKDTKVARLTSGGAFSPEGDTWTWTYLLPNIANGARTGWEIGEVVTFHGDKAGHITATGGEGPFPIISDVPGENNKIYWLTDREFFPKGILAM